VLRVARGWLRAAQPQPRATQPQLSLSLLSHSSVYYRKCSGSRTEMAFGEVKIGPLVRRYWRRFRFSIGALADRFVTLISSHKSDSRGRNTRMCGHTAPYPTNSPPRVRELMVLALVVAQSFVAVLPHLASLPYLTYFFTSNYLQNTTR